MVDLLRRSISPVTDEAWKAIDQTAVRVLKGYLTARTVVDFDGPHGWHFGAVNLGRLEASHEPAPSGVPWGVRKVLPLVEVRIPFVLKQMELDNVSRGEKNPDLAPLEKAAREAALFEETAVYRGFPEGGIEGILPQSEHPPIALPQAAEQIPPVVAEGVRALSLAGIPGPYTLVLGSRPFFNLLRSAGNYPPSRVVRELIGGKILHGPALDGGVLLSQAGGFFELTVGQDFSVGYHRRNHDTVDLFLTESFTFRVLERKAAVELRAG